MTNKEKYKQAFSVLHAPDHLALEVENMERANKRSKGRAVVATVAACVMIVGSAAAAYAADLGGIQRTIQLWIHGDQTEATIQFDGDGNYNMEYADNEGNIVQQGGGGVAIGEDGTETPLSEEELLEHVTVPEVDYKEDGSVWVYWFDQQIEITDQFEDDICYVKLVSGEDVLYMTVKYQNGFATSRSEYLSPSTFNDGE